MFWDMTDVFCYPTLENDKCEVRSWNNIVPSPGGSSDKILQFLFNPVSFLISTDPVMSKFVPVTPTQSRPQGFSLKKMGGAPHPIFKGKALGTSLTPTVVINMFPIDVDYSQDILKTQVLQSAAGCSTTAMSISPVEFRIRELQTAPPGIKSVSSQSLKGKLARIVQHYRAKVSQGNHNKENLLQDLVNCFL